ncbi:MAG: AAA family ATPase [Lachnospiraceae bacterium]|nr:AAA family ATPase [Lachnospiraceae bacterium]
MLIGRAKEYQYFEDLYENPESKIVVFYGAKMLGKTAFALDFVKDKPYAYCYVKSGGEEFVYEDLKKTAAKLSASDKKQVLILDEFQNAAHAPEFLSKIKELTNYGNLLVILISSANTWVETQIVHAFGKSVTAIHGFYKIKELSFADICKMYPEVAADKLFALYAVFGGVPGIWQYVQTQKSIESIICKAVLAKESFLFQAGYSYCVDGLRDTGVYDVILSAIAAGNTKLNDLHKLTGFNRAKISVYLKALMEQGQVDKILSYEVPKTQSSKVGIYEIVNHFTLFWFTFIFPHYNELIVMEPEVFYHTYIAPGFMAYTDHFVKDVVKEAFIKKGYLPAESAAFSNRYLGKKGEVELIWKGENGFCGVYAKNRSARVGIAEYEAFLDTLKETGASFSEYTFVSDKGFEKKLSQKADGKLHLIEFSELLTLVQKD